MITKTLYVKGGIYTLEAIKDYKGTMTRLIADDGKLLTNGIKQVSVIDIVTKDIPKWSEVDAPAEPVVIDPDAAAVELPLVKAELLTYKTAVADIAKLNMNTALKGEIVAAVDKLKAAVAVKAEEKAKEV